MKGNLKGHLPGRWVDFVGSLVGPLLFDLGLNKGCLSLLVSFVDTLLRTGKGGYNDVITGPRGSKGRLESLVSLVDPLIWVGVLEFTITLRRD